MRTNARNLVQRLRPDGREGALHQTFAHDGPALVDMIPFSVTIAEIASPPSTLSFMLWGAGIVVFPLTLIYTAVNYRVFRGKTTSRDAYD
jgi:hypothetical protein